MSVLPKVCVVGCGHWGKNLARNFFELGALGAITDPHQPTLERVSSEFSVKGLSFDEAINDPKIEAVVISSPLNCMHLWLSKPLRRANMSMSKNP